MDALGLVLGTAAVKGILRLWTGDTTFSGLEDGPIDAVGNQLFGYMEQRAKNRQLEALADEIARKIQPLLSNEIGGLDPGERASAIEAAQASLDKVGALDPKIAVSLDLSAEALTLLIKETDPEATRRSGLSAAGVGFYDTLINECSAYIISVVHGLPGYSAAQATELLCRTSKLTEIAKEVLQCLPTSAVPNSWGPGSDNQRFEARYKRAVADFSDQLYLYGVTSDRAKAPYQLSVAYISLAVEVGESREKVETSLNEELELGAPLGVHAQLTDGSMRIESLLEGSSNLILTGGAGSGKTTLLQWLALSAVSEENKTGPLSPWSERIPFIIPLRRFVAEPFPAPEDFVGTISPNLPGAMPHGWVHHILSEGRAMLLIDGLDEIPRDRRNEAQTWVQNLMKDFPNNKIVVTSRTIAVTRRWANASEFRIATLQPMNFSDIRAFVKHWHHAASLSSGKLFEQNVIDSGKNLLNTIRDTPAIRSLCTSPLLCALVCALHLESGANLPNNRMDIYSTALEMLVIRRDNDRNVYRLPEHELGYREREYLLRAFAIWMHENGASDSTRHDYEDRIDRNMKNLHKVAEESNVVASYLLERSGVLREPIPGRIDFVHRTFQEYLAAAAVIEDNSIERLVLMAHEDHWREVIVMAAGHANSVQRTQLLKGLLDRAETDEVHRPRLVMLAVACMETSPNIDAALVHQLQQALSSVLPPTNMTEAAAVASAGTLAVQLLKSAGQGADVAAACVRALSLIGGDSALEALATYRKDSRVTVTRQLIRSWSGFDTEAYAKNVLADSPLDRGRILMKDPEQLPYLSILNNASQVLIDVPGALPDPKSIPGDDPRILSLDASRNPQIDSLRELPNMPGLIALSFKNNLISNLNGIERFKSLEYLDLSQNRLLSDISGILELPGLRFLDLSGTRIESLDSIEGCKSLQRLNINGSTELKSIENAIPVRVLSLPFAPNLSSLEGISKSLDLESLILGVISKNVKNLSLPENLKFLRLSFGAMSNLDSISGAPSLASLAFSGPFTNFVINWISGLRNLDIISWECYGEVRGGVPMDEAIELIFDKTNISKLVVWSRAEGPDFPYISREVFRGRTEYSRLVSV